MHRQYGYTNQIPRKGRLRARRCRFLDVLETFRVLPALLLHGHLRAPGRGRRHDVPHHPFLGLVRRSGRRDTGRPDTKPPGEIQALPAVVRRPLRHGGRTDFHYSGLRDGREAGLRLYYLRSDDDDLLAHQRPLRFAAGSHLRQPQVPHGTLLLPDDLRLRRQHPGTADHRTAGGMVQPGQRPADGLPRPYWRR